MHTVVCGISQMLINLCTGLFIITLTFKILIANRIMSNFQCKDQDCSILHRTSHGLLVQWQKTPLHCLCKWSFMLSSFFLVHFDWLYMLQIKIIPRPKQYSGSQTRVTISNRRHKNSVLIQYFCAKYLRVVQCTLQIIQTIKNWALM